MEAQPDTAKDMNELKGAVQDLSNLCKDMLREINDIKSINLTLRCGIENLRHENEERDQVIADLKHRLDSFENGRGTVNKPVKCIVCNTVLEQNTEGSLILDGINSKDKYITFGQTTHEETGTVEETTYQEHKEVIKSKVDSYVTEESKENRQDWTWKGRKAVELEESAEESVEEEVVTEGSEVGEEIAQGWETLQEELESEYKVKEEVVYTSIKDNAESSNPYSDEEILNSEYETEDESLIEKEPHTEEVNNCSEKEYNPEGEAEPTLSASDKLQQEPIEEEEEDEEEDDEEEDEREEQRLENINTFQEKRDFEGQENTTATHNDDTNSETITQEKASSVECSSLDNLEDKLPVSGVELNEHGSESTNSNYYENKTTEHLQFKAKPSLYDSGEEEEEEDLNEDETNSTLEVIL